MAPAAAPAPSGANPGRFLLDISPLRHDREYRWLWLGQLVSNMGRQVTLIALPFQLYLLTGSVLAIGGLAAVTLGALLVFSLPGGSLADAFDRRRLLLVTQLALAACSLLLAALALTGRPPIGLIYLVAFAAAIISTVDLPARRASMARLVAPERLPAALVLDQASYQAAGIIGPALGGVLIAVVGIPMAYLLDALTFGAAVAAVWALRPLPVAATARRPGLTSIREGLAFVGRAPAIRGSFIVDLVAMVFGMPTALFPILAITTFHGGAEMLGLLTAAPAVGALVGALTTGWVSGVSRQGRAVVLAVAGWGFAITAFGLVLFSLPLALLCLAVAGAADVVSAVFRVTIVQLSTPDALRGRLTAVHTLVVSGGPRLGDMESTAVAAVAGAPFAAFSGGVLCLVGLVIVAWRLPEFVAYRAAPRREAGPG